MIFTQQAHINIAMFLSFLTWQFLLKDIFIDEFYDLDQDMKYLLIKGSVIAIILLSINALYYWILL